MRHETWRDIETRDRVKTRHTSVETEPRLRLEKKQVKTVSRQDTCLVTPPLPSTHFSNPDHIYTRVQTRTMTRFHELSDVPAVWTVQSTTSDGWQVLGLVYINNLITSVRIIINWWHKYSTVLQICKYQCSCKPQFHSLTINSTTKCKSPIGKATSGCSALNSALAMATVATLPSSDANICVKSLHGKTQAEVFLVDWLSCGFTSHSTQNRSFRRRSPSQYLG